MRTTYLLDHVLHKYKHKQTTQCVTWLGGEAKISHHPINKCLMDGEAHEQNQGIRNGATMIPQTAACWLWLNTTGYQAVVDLNPKYTNGGYTSLVLCLCWEAQT